MDIYSAEHHIKKLHEYIEEVYKSPTGTRGLYQKSRVRYRGIANSCISVVNMISEILQEELLQSDTTEFSGYDTSTLLKIVSDVESKLEDVKRFAGVKATPSAPSVIPTNSRKHVMRDYAKAFDELLLSTKLQRYPEIQKCVRCIDDWFDTRFFEYKSEDFRYNIRRIPSWVQSFVIVIGKAIQNETYDEFYQELSTWLKCVKFEGSAHAVPYSIYAVDKTLHPSDITLTSVILWDVLMDCGLNQLCKEDPLYLSRSQLYDLCSKLNPDELDSYRNYDSDPSVLLTCKLVEVSA